MTATFTTAGKIITGAGSVEELGQVARGFGSRALLVTGRRALRAAGTTERLVGILKAAGVDVVLFEQVEPEPVVHTVDQARELLCSEACELVVAAGGGSAIDVGKAAAALADADATTGEYFSQRPIPAAGRPCIAVPTTAGTGAEATSNSVLTDPDRQIKQSIRGPGLMPEVAIVDAALTVSCPPEVTASAGMDALTQAVESYFSRLATPLTDALAIMAARLIWPNLPTAFENGRDLPAREALSYGSLLAGMALANARLGAAHGMAHPIGYRCGIPHGVVCAALLPHVLRFNREAAGRKYHLLSGICHGDAADAVDRLLERLALPKKLSDLGLREELFDRIAEESMPSGSTKANPRPVTVKDVKTILRRL